jgi:DNA mismatch repair protein MutS
MKTEYYKQFLEFKNMHPEAVLLFRTGEFYMTYQEDAEEAARILGIALTKSESKNVEEVECMKMAGFPHAALDSYLPKLIRAGKRVAICDQLEAPKQKQVRKGITELVK